MSDSPDLLACFNENAAFGQSWTSKWPSGFTRKASPYSRGRQPTCILKFILLYGYTNTAMYFGLCISTCTCSQPVKTRVDCFHMILSRAKEYLGHCSLFGVYMHMHDCHCTLNTGCISTLGLSSLYDYIFRDQMLIRYHPLKMVTFQYCPGIYASMYVSPSSGSWESQYTCWGAAADVIAQIRAAGISPLPLMLYCF